MSKKLVITGKKAKNSIKWVKARNSEKVRAQLFEVKASGCIWPLRIKEPLGVTDRMVRFNIFAIFLRAGDFVNVDGESMHIVKKSGLTCEVLRGVYGSVVSGHVKGAKALMCKKVDIVAR